MMPLQVAPLLRCSSLYHPQLLQDSTLWMVTLHKW